MGMQRRQLLVDPPATAAPDIAFILIIFFLVCASVQPDNGKPQEIPNSEETPDEANQSQNIEVSLTEKNILVNGSIIPDDKFPTRLAQLLQGKTKESDRVVVVKSDAETTYQRWILVTSMIEQGGGIVTLQLEQEQTTIVD